MTKFLGAILFVFAVLALMVLAVGYSEKPLYTDSLTETFDESSDVIWNLLTDIRAYPENKADVIAVEIISNDRGLHTWREELEGGGFRLYRHVSKKNQRNVVIELTQSSSELTGTWEFTLRRLENGRTQVTIKEESITEGIWMRGFNKVRGRDVYLIQHMKFIRVGVFQTLLRQR